MRTPEEIKMGLVACDTIACEECPYALMIERENEKIVIGCEENVQQEALAYIQQLEAQVPRWVSVEERLPKMSESVIVQYKSGFVSVGFVNGGKWYAHISFYPQEGITHWMPLPKPPEEVQP